MEIPKLKRARRRRGVRRVLDKAEHGITKVPGPSTNPATNLLIGDIAMRGISMLLGRGIEKIVLTARYDAEKAAGIVKGRSLKQSMVATGVARVATRSVPGFLVVTGGMLAKSLFDRSFGRHEASRKGDRKLAEQADQTRDG